MLDGCRFFGVEADSVNVPGWPCLTLRSPKSLVSGLRAKALPGRLSAWVEAVSWSPDETRLLVVLVPSLAMQVGVSEEVLRDVLITAGGQA